MLLPFELQRSWSQCDGKCLAEVEKALDLWVEGMNRNMFPLTALFCARKYWAYMKMSARDS